MNKEKLISILVSPNGPELAAAMENEGEILQSVLDIASGTSLFTETESVQAAILSYMVRVGKKKAACEAIDQVVTKEVLEGLITSSDAKVRKNAARLIGTLQRANMDVSVGKALRNETVRMVRPSMILTLGVLGTESAAETLKKYTIEPAQDKSEEKHVLKEKEALRKALRQVEGTEGEIQALTFTGIKGSGAKQRVELRTERGFEQALAEEVKEKQVAERIVSVRPGAVLIENTSPENLRRVRSYKEFLIPLGTIKKADSEDLTKEAKQLAQWLVDAMRLMHEEQGPYRFRLETGRSVSGEGKSRGSETAALASAMEEASGGSLINAPGSYQCELRIKKIAVSESLAAYLKLFTIKDDRFDYRKLAIAASIHPSGAAGLMQIAKPYAKEGAIVLDPCCGSGTLLMERAHLQRKKPAALIGIDLSDQALKAATENMKAGKDGLKGMKAKLIRGNMLDAQLPGKVDELYANLPFGNRVGTHKENVVLYAGLFDRLSGWIRKGGIAVLYSMEGSLLEKEASKHPELEVLHKQRVEAGGLEPTVLILRIK